MIRRLAVLIALGLLVSPVHADDGLAHTMIFHVEGMTCGLCARAIDKALREVDGVRSVEIDREAERVSVRTDGALSTGRLERAIEAAGRYEAEPIE